MQSESPEIDVGQVMQVGIEHHQAGRLPEAESYYQRVLQADPNNPDALHLLGVIAFQVGKYEIAVQLYDRALIVNQNYPEALSNRGNALKALGRYEEALESYGRAIAIRPDYVEAFYNRGNTLRALNRFEGALTSYDDALSIKPYYVEALLNRANALQALNRYEEALLSYEQAFSIQPPPAQALCDRGVALQALGRHAEALESYDRSIASQPGYAEAWFNRGNAYQALERQVEALSSYDRGIALKQNYSEAFSNRGNTLFVLGRHADALSSYDRALAINCDYAEALSNRGNVLHHLRQYDLALASYDRALAIRPDFSECLSNRGNALQEMGRYAEALEGYDRALALQPDFAQALSNRGAALHELKRYDEALESYQRALCFRPDYAEALCDRGNVLKAQGRLREAVESYRKALDVKPDYDVAHSNIIFVLDLIEGFGAKEQQEERRNWYARHGRKHAKPNRHYDNMVDSERKLRIGYVSADFRRHAASFAFAPIIRFHDRAMFEVFCYSGVTLEDDVTIGLKQAASAWRSTLSMSDEDLAVQIRRDEIDILVDLSAHMAGNRLLTFARRPAPVQVTAWGYPNGTGMPTIDYLFADKVVVPAEERNLFAEEIVDLPCFLSYEPPDYLPKVAPLPAKSGSPFTLGCISRIEKISDSALCLWGRIMAELPGARLLIKGMTLDDREHRSRFIGRLNDAGIAEQKVRLIGQTSHLGLLQTFHEIDLALDPFPHGGAIGTAEALWMGVPVVTLRGATFMSRISASILSALEMPEWIAGSQEEYVRIAVEASNNLNGLARTRAELRAHLVGSIFGNPERYTRAVESAYRSIWRRWCEKGTAKDEY